MTKKQVILLIVSLFLIYIFYTVYGFKKYGYSLNQEVTNEYLFLFTDSILQSNKFDVSVSYVNKNNVYTFLPYVTQIDTVLLSDTRYILDKRKRYGFRFWEFMSLSEIELPEIDIFTDMDLNSLKVYQGEVLNAKSVPISIKYGHRFNERIHINVDNQSTIYRYINGDNYKGFIGNLNRISFSNEKNKHIVFIDFYWRDVLFLLLKKDGRFFIIMVTAHKDLPVDENLLKFLNLE